MTAPKAFRPKSTDPLECKRAGEKATESQRSFLASVLIGGGIAAVVRGYEDARSLLFDERDTNTELTGACTATDQSTDASGRPVE